ncbi:condensation domain-containing protein [Planotetraspora sp. A-T 1434]|uniref:condensation domain-containing protein n=1 Tax=Planotetraspora sp. A-T 1434 TaxID=2979219 RepID=UPI0021BF45B7|nr:condensation domain-containing protein [Planotetraspora sp. A-T 1434]MCT9933366.1 condensation domain-containing protein [Planotetraspora sp. A-T 1434]
MTHVTARFSGGRDRSGPLTTAQANMVRCVLRDPPEHMNYLVVRQLPPDVTTARVAEGVGLLVSRHESLRTTFHDGVQRVGAEGELAIEVTEDEAVAARLRERRFDLAGEPPLRAAVITSGDIPRQIVFVTTHSTVDAGGLAVLLADWDEIIQDKPLEAVTAPQPLDVAEMERTPASVRRAAAALRYWEAQLRRIPQSTLTVTVDDSQADWKLPRLRVRSVAAARALARIGARTGVTRSAAVLAAFGALAGLRAGQPTCPVISISANRYRPELRDHVGPLAQDALIPIDIAGPSFDALLQSTRAASLAAYQNSRFDSAALVEIMEEVQRSRGVFFARDLVFNDMSVPGQNGRVSRDPSGAPDIRSVWLPEETLPTRVSLWVNRLDGEADVTLWADPRCLPRADAQALGEGIMRLLIEAGDRDVDLSELTALTGIAPLPRGDGWLVADSCWVDLAEVERLVADAVDGPSRVVAVPDEELGHRLVCHLTAPVTPEEAHSACLAKLPGRMAAMAPHDYVIR